MGAGVGLQFDSPQAIEPELMKWSAPVTPAAMARTADPVRWRHSNRAPRPPQTTSIWVYPLPSPPLGERLIFGSHETLPATTFCFEAQGWSLADAPSVSRSIGQCADLLDSSYVQRDPTSEEILLWNLVSGP